MPPNFFSGLSSVAAFAMGVKTIVSEINSLANQIAPFFVCIAFVLLVFGIMRGFLQNDTRHFFGNLLRVVILVVLIGNWQTMASIVTNAVTAFCNGQTSSNFFGTTSGGAPGTGQLNLAQLQNTIFEKGLGLIASESALQELLNMLSPINHAVCVVLFGIYLLALLLCELIVALMNLIQQCLLIFLGLYVPIGFAEFSIPSLRGQAEGFFKTYIGVQCWPIGWLFVNIVTIALFQGLAAPNPEDPGQIVLAIVVCVPILLWVVIGYALAPFYAQKIVMRGGAEIQAFAGAMISAVGGTSGAVYGGAFALTRGAQSGLNRLAQAIRTRRSDGDSNSRSAINNGDQGNDSSGDQGANAENVDNHLWPERRETQSGGAVNGGVLGGGDKARALVWGITKVIDAGEFASKTVGNVAGTLGSLVADASGNRIGPERNFSFPQIRRNRPNRSSQRAADYLNQ
jgi:hypothetical protein